MTIFLVPSTSIAWLAVCHTACHLCLSKWSQRMILVKQVLINSFSLALLHPLQFCRSMQLPGQLARLQSRLTQHLRRLPASAARARTVTL